MIAQHDNAPPVCTSMSPCGGLPRPRRGGRALSLAITLALGCGSLWLLGCDGGSNDATVAHAATHLRVASAKGVDDDGNDLSGPAYEQAARSAQSVGDPSAALIGADALAAQAQSALKRATAAWARTTSDTAAGQALLLRLSSERALLADLQSFDPSPARSEIGARRGALQAELRAVEGGLDELRSAISGVEARVEGLRAQAREQRDAGEDLRERAGSADPIRRAELIALANERERAADGFEKQGELIGVELRRVVYLRQAGEDQLASIRRQLETLMQRERALEADIASRSQQAASARENATRLGERIGGLINTMAERYNAEIAPALDEAIRGYEGVAQRARQAQSTVGNTVRLSVGSSEHALASTHRTHAMMLESMLSFVDQASARGVTGGVVPELARELRAKLDEARAAGEEAGDQAAGSLSGGGARGRAGEILNEVASTLRRAESGGASPDEPID